MEMDSQERGEIGDDSPVSHNEEEMSDGEAHSGAEQDSPDCDDLRRQGLLAVHNGVLKKLQRQVEDINVRVSNGSFPYPSQDEFENQRNQLSFAMSNRGQESNIQFPVPFSFPHPAAPFLPPMAPPPQPTSSGSSHSSEGSASSQHTWSFEEQFKQVRQLYEINDDPKRKEFLDDLFSFMQRRSTPINRLPIMAKSVLDLYELYNLVIARGGLVDVINKKLWQEIIKGLHLPSSITSAAFTLRTQYMKYLYNYECEKKNLSSPAELQAAIDGNRREGRRSSYGQYDAMSRYGYESPNPNQLNPLSLVTAAAAQHQHLARMSSAMSGGMNLHNGTHHGSHPQSMNPPTNGVPLPNIPNLSNMAPNDVVNVFEYMKLFNKEFSSRGTANTSPRQLDMSPPNGTSPLIPFEVQQRLSLFNLYNNNATLANTPTQQQQQQIIEPQREPINLSETTPAIKREPESVESPPPAKIPKRVQIQTEREETRSKSPESPVSTPSRSCNVTPRTTIKISNRDGKRNSDNTLVVSMEVNGITYEGILFAQNGQSSNAAISS